MQVSGRQIDLEIEDMYYEFESRQNMKAMIFDEDGLKVGEDYYPYKDVEGFEIIKTPLFSTYGILRITAGGKDHPVPFPKSYSEKLKRVLRELEREQRALQAAGQSALKDSRQDILGKVHTGSEADSAEDRTGMVKEGLSTSEPQAYPDTGRVLMDPYEEMKKVKELLDLDIITREEFDRKKKELLGL